MFDRQPEKVCIADLCHSVFNANRALKGIEVWVLLLDYDYPGEPQQFIFPERFLEPSRYRFESACLVLLGPRRSYQQVPLSWRILPQEEREEVKLALFS